MARRQLRKNFRPVKRPGALTRKAKRSGMSNKAYARKHYNDKGLTGEQARFAVIARKWHHGRGRSSRG